MLGLLTIQSHHQMKTSYNVQFDEIFSNFEIANMRLFRVGRGKFKPERCRLTDERFEALMFINCNKH